MQRSGDVAITGARKGRARDELRRALLGGALIGMFVGCAGGEDKDTSGFSGYASNLTTPTNPTGMQGETGDASSSGGTTEGGSSTSPVDPTTGGGPTTVEPTTEPPMTTGPDVTSAPMTTDDSTTTTTGDDSTTTTTTNDASSTTEPPPPPPPKDPQPANGLYADCFAKTCDNTTDGCFELTDQNDVKIDGYCTLLCNGDADCQPKPNAPAVSKCVDIGGNQKVCMLSCNGVIDCPTGMTCESVNLNGQTAKFCW